MTGEIEQEITVDEAANAEGDVMGVVTIGSQKVRYFVGGNYIKDATAKGYDIVAEVKGAIIKISTQKVGTR